MIDLRCMKEDSPNRKPLMNLLAGRNWLVEVRHECNCLRVETGGEWEDYYHNSVNRKLRESLRRRKKGLRRLGQVSVERHVALDRIEEVLELFFQAHISRWKAMGKSSPFENKSMRQFYLSLAANLAKKNMLQLTTLTIDGRPIGYHFGFLHNNKLYGYSTAFEMGFARYSPGSLLLEAEIKTAFEAGLREVDMLRGEERYKYEWTDKKKELLAVAIYDRAFYRWLLHSYYTRIKPTLQASEGFKKVRYWARAVKRRGGNHSI